MDDATTPTPPDWEAFGRAVMKNWPEQGIDGFEIHDLAEKHAILRKVPGGYDPEKHAEVDDAYYLEPGDDLFERNYPNEPA